MADRDDLPPPPAPRKVSFTGPGQYILWMAVFLAAVIGVAALVVDPLITAFQANPAINGLILGVLLIGILYTFQQALMIAPSARWLVRLRDDSQDASRLPVPPALIAPMAALVTDASDGRVRLSAASARVVLDSVAARMAESGAFTRYFGRLLIFLGLLGTFYGLLLVVSDVGDAVRAVSASATGGEADAARLMSAIEDPISGMGTAFASSLFGLAGSLVIGFLELQASRAQNRFYNEIEEWLSTISRLASAGPSSGQMADGEQLSAAYLGALVEQTAETLDQLSHTLERHNRQLETTLARVAEDAAESQREAARLLRDEIKVLVRALEAQARMNRDRRGDDQG